MINYWIAVSVYIWNSTIWHTIIFIKHAVIPTETHRGPRREDRMLHGKQTVFYIIHLLSDNWILIHRMFRIIPYFYILFMLLHKIDEIVFISFCLPAILFRFFWQAISFFVHEQTIHSIVRMSCCYVIISSIFILARWML